MPTLHQQGCVDVLTLDDRFTADNVDEARGALMPSFDSGLPQVVLDLRKVKFVDSAGLELICEMHAECRKRGGELRLAAPGRLVRDVLSITGLASQLAIADDALAAAGEFTQ